LPRKLKKKKKKLIKQLGSAEGDADGDGDGDEDDEEKVLEDLNQKMVSKDQPAATQELPPADLAPTHKA
jgi:hypothetical protein